LLKEKRKRNKLKDCIYRINFNIIIIIMSRYNDYYTRPRFGYPVGYGYSSRYSISESKYQFGRSKKCKSDLDESSSSQDSSECEKKQCVTTWRINYLVSNKHNVAAHVDPRLINPWGIVIYNNQLWVVNNTSDVMTNYDLLGNRILTPISLRHPDHKSDYPTGIVINVNGSFTIPNGSNTKPATFLIATEKSTLLGYNPNIDQNKSFMLLNKLIDGEIAVYRGIAIVNNTLLLANFFGGSIDVFTSEYQRIVNYEFIDRFELDPIPEDYGPNNIVNIGCFIYVLWAKKNPNVPLRDIPGPGNGFVSVFDLNGSFVRRFTSRGVLNSPWAMIPAPLESGFPEGSFLIGNNGDGRINVFDFEGGYIGPMLNQAGLPIVIEGLWGLAPYYTDFNQIFFTASNDQTSDGLVGSLVRDQVIYF
jgi:uncharacterized protein (TIGR03118 family)